MYNFEYKNPVKIIFGKGTIPNVVNEIPKNAKVLLTYGGGSIKKTGVYEQVTKVLNKIEFIEFGGIEANPHYETCMKAVDIIKKEKINFLLSVGGGSVLDATKFIAAATLYKNGDPWEILNRRNEIFVEEAMPIGAVLTLPATGSEMNGNSVITRISRMEKLAFGSPKVMPKFSILDPECVFTLPDTQVSNGVVDAFVHVVEQYLTFNVNSPIQDRFAESILTTLIEEGPKVLADRKDYESAANFMWSATMALNGLIGAGVAQDWATHLIGHELTALHGIDHAQTLAIVLPGMMHVKRQNKKDKILQYGERIWGIKSGTDNEKIDKAITKTIEFFESVGIKTTLPDYGVPAETINIIMARFEKRGNKLGENADIDFNEVGEILRNRL
ncbi:MAG: iron-containing alcohol dehydrogenase [Prolixibacteraceae bacterium]|jgi:NADP-dependent alcohol dehydrogenase|nr:iron-containing alcohol dehydrogenase [Prolixibacteraceae bacterium]MBT6765506.1 iron-containing alcohol dehydrogenase [Prolixibacteraceae bacterium]MBT6997051.1 iron-containing alcohol dehydrogenase [Prolixibacteraceae bacterium]MBT7396894.1 iron-containing alcohol dehydrogenase [Prolixibacteraceae bacterium]